MTLSNAQAAGVRGIVRCRETGHQVEPDPSEMSARYGGEMTVGDGKATRMPVFGSRLAAGQTGIHEKSPAEAGREGHGLQE